MRMRRICSRVFCTGWVALLLFAVGACSSKAPQYPADHDRIRSIDQAVDALRHAYQAKNRSEFRSWMQPNDQLDALQQQVDEDFDTYSTISLEFKIERVMIEGDDIDVYLHWQGVWKSQADDAGMRQRGHARLQWTGAHSVKLQGMQGDLPFGVKAKQALSELPLSQPASR